MIHFIRFPLSNLCHFCDYKKYIIIVENWEMTKENKSCVYVFCVVIYLSYSFCRLHSEMIVDASVTSNWEYY